MYMNYSMWKTEKLENNQKITNTLKKLPILEIWVTHTNKNRIERSLIQYENTIHDILTYKIFSLKEDNIIHMNVNS